MDKHRAAIDIITHALPLVPFDGWNQRTLNQAAIDAGYKKTDVIRIFPGGVIDAIDNYMRHADTQLIDMLKDYHLKSMKLRERIATLVRLRIMVYEPHREAVRKALALQAMPFYCHHGLRSLYRTVDTIWHEAGDTSTDFNYYTKRMTLAAVYSTSLLYWLEDESPSFDNSWGFLDRRIANVMSFEKAKWRIKQWTKQFTMFNSSKL